MRNIVVFTFITLTAALSALVSTNANGAEPDAATFAQKHRGPQQVAAERYFRDEVWVKIAQRMCLKCHNPGGDAQDSELILTNPAKLPPEKRAEALRKNLAAFEKMALKQRNGKSRLLLKVVGKLAHEGKKVIKPDSTRYRILEGFVARVGGKGVPKVKTTRPYADYDPPPFFDGVTMLDNRQLLRRITLSLAARLPTTKEQAAVEKGGLKAVNIILDRIMTEDAFYDRLAEGFNDIFLTRGFNENAESFLSYNHFGKTRLWYQKYDLNHIKDAKERQRARWKLADVYRETLLREPMELIKYIVLTKKPFTPIVTADYIMVSPYSSRGYGVYEQIKDRFKDTKDPFEYIPVRLKALKHRDGRNHQVTPTGHFPHAGILSTFQYLKRYPTTETNRNRLRVRMYYQHFLGIDIMALAPRVNDAAAITAKYEIPTMQAPDCVVCHKTVDPVAGLFQDYQTKSNDFGLRKEGWFKDMFGPGWEGVDLPESERWRVLPWLGEQTAKDPRFAVAMVEHVWYILTGRKVLLAPQDIEDPLFASKQRAYRMQRDEIEKTADRFAKNGFNLKHVFQALVASPFYRADGLTTAAKHPRRRAELDDLGIVRLLSPEQLERKIEAIFGKRWGKLERQTAILYGGIDSKQITQRITEPSGAMGAIQRIMANDVSIKTVAIEFTTDPAKRRLFANIEPDVVPGSPEADRKIRATIVHLHNRVLGQFHTPDHPEVRRTFELFTGIIAEANSRKRFEKNDIWFSRTTDNKTMKDPHYTVRAWRAVLTYLLRQHDFLYE